MTRLGMVAVTILMACCVALLAEGEWLDAAAMLGLSIFIAREDRNLRRVNARKDLRVVYPPRRDRFHRDLERLSKLRGTSVPPPETARALVEWSLSSDGTEMYDPATQSRYLRLPDGRYVRLDRLRAAQAELRGRRSSWQNRYAPAESTRSTVYHGLRHGFFALAPFLVIVLLGALILIGLVASLL